MKKMLRRWWILLFLQAVLCFISPTSVHATDGVPVWTNRYDGPFGGAEQMANALVVDKNGNVFVTGYSDTTNGYYDYATIKYSGAGVPLWTNYYNGPGNGTDTAAAITVDGSGNVFVSGYSYDHEIANPDYATVAYSAAGVPLWTNRYNGPGNGIDIIKAITVDGRAYMVPGCVCLD